MKRNHLILATTLILILSCTTLAYALKTGGSYEVTSDLIGFGGSDDGQFQSGGGYTNDSSYSLLGATASGAGYSLSSGFAPSLNNVPEAALSSPADGAAINDNTPDFSWIYSDSDGDPQGGFNVEISNNADFSPLNPASSGEVDSTDTSWTPSSALSDGVYWWRVKVKDSPWEEWSTKYSTRQVTIDTTPPENLKIDSITTAFNNGIIYVSATDQYSGVEYRIRYSLSTGFEASISTTTEWFTANSTQTMKLESDKTYYFQAQARDSLGNTTSWSTTYTATTEAQAPSISIVDTSTDTIKFLINPSNNPIDSTYCIRVILPDDSIKYVQLDGTLGDTQVWADIDSWGGIMDGFVVQLPFAPNEQFILSLGAKDGLGTVYCDFEGQTIAYTSAGVPEISLTGATESSISASIDTAGNSIHTTYAIRAVLANGATRYVQSNGMLSGTKAWQYSDDWGAVTINSLTPNMGYAVSVQARSGGLTETDFSVGFTTWTRLVTPNAPVVKGGFDDYYKNYVSVNINPVNSEFTEYAILQVLGGLENYIKGNGEYLKAEDDPELKWKTEAEWETGFTNIIANLFIDNVYSFKIKARSVARGEETGFSSLGSGRAPPGKPGTPICMEKYQDVISLQWPQGLAASAIKYGVYYTSSVSGGLTFIDTVNSNYPLDTFFEHDIDGSMPDAPANSWMYSEISSIKVQWAAVSQPDPSPVVYYKVGGINSEDSEGERSDFSAGISMQPELREYKIYFDTFSVVVSTTLSREYIFTGLLPNTEYKYQVTAITTDDLESAKSAEFSIYTLAELVSNAEAEPGWSVTSKYFNQIEFEHNGNPGYTEYSIDVSIPSHGTFWLDGSGSTTTARTWIAGTSWMHAGLTRSTVYTYQIYSRNVSGEVTDGKVVASAETIDLERPCLSDVQCLYSKSLMAQRQSNKNAQMSPPIYPFDDARLVPSNYPCNSTLPYFAWDIAYTSFPVVGYSISWSTDEAALPDDTTDYVNVYEAGAYWSTAISHSKGEQQNYYFHVKALDNEDQWSATESYVFHFLDDITKPNLDDSVIGILGAYEYREGNAYFGAPLDIEITIPFEESMSRESLNEDNIYIHAIYNSLEEPVDQNVSATLEYNSDDDNKFLKVSANLSSNWTYELVITTGVQDEVWNPLEAECRKTLRTLISADTDATNIVWIQKTPALSAKLTLPPGSLKQDAYIIMNEDPLNKTIKSVVPRAIFNDAASKMGSKNRPQWYVEVDMYDLNHNKIEGSDGFNSPVEISMTYQDDDNDGVVDDTRVKAKTLSVWWLNEEKSVWVKIPSRIDTADKSITATVNHFSMFAIVGAVSLSVEDVVAAPVPWIPEDGKDKTGTLNEGVMFRGLPDEGELFVYTVAGNRVYHRQFTSAELISTNYILHWDGKNNDGQYVASGIYFWVAKSAEGKKTGKLIVIR